MLNHKGTVVLNTDRLLLRPFVKEDAEAVFNYSSDDRVTKYLPWKSMQKKEEAMDKCIERAEKYSNPKYYHWAIVIKETNQLIGFIKLAVINEEKEYLEMGYGIGFEYWGNGYVAEALKEVIKFFFQEIGFHRIETTHHVENTGSGKVMKKCGMKFEGVLRERLFNNNMQYVDSAIYSILKSDFGEKN